MKKKRIVIKVGTNVLQNDQGKLDYNLIRDLADQIAQIHGKGVEVVLVSSGSVGAGRELNSFQNQKNELLREQMMASVGQVRLMQIYSDFFLEHQIVIGQVLVTRFNFDHRPSYLNIRNTLTGLLESNVLPIINENDTVATEELHVQFGDNDRLAVFIAAMIGADALFFLTSASGLLADFGNDSGQNGQLIETVTELNEEILNYCRSMKSSAGKGGMLSKVNAAGMAISFGIETYIVSGKSRDVVLRILEGEKTGTHFVAYGEKVNSYRKWLAAGAQSKGRLIIDSGAERALLNKKSLLAAGIISVIGEFEVKDLVCIYNHSNTKIGTGRIEMASGELKTQIEEKQNDADQSRKKRSRKAVISRDHLILV